MLWEKAGLTIEDLVTATGIPRGTLYNWEAGIRMPPIDMFPIALGVKVQTLLPDE